jgi:hypothetical protein
MAAPMHDELASGHANRALIKKFVDGTIVPHATIKERYLRFPKASFVYSVAM